MLDDLRLLAVIAAAGSLSSAAKSEGIAEASLSRAVERLERKAGAPLFDRLPRGLRLTPTGEQLLPAAKAQQIALHDAETLFRCGQGEPTGDLRVSGDLFGIQGFLAPILADLLARYPSLAIDLRLVSEDHPDPVAQGRDVILCVGRPDAPHLVARKVGETTICPWAAARTVPSAGVTDPETIAELPRIEVDQPGLGDRWLLTEDATGRAMRLEGPRVATVNDPMVATEMTRAGAGITLMPAFWGEQPANQTQFARLLPGWTGPTIEVFAVMPPQRSAVPAVRVFLDAIARTMRKLTR